MRASRVIPFDDSTPSLLVATGLVESPTGQPASWLKRALEATAAMWPLVVLARLGILLTPHGAATILWLRSHIVLGTVLLGLLCIADALIIFIPRATFENWSFHARLRWLLPLIFVSAGSYSVLSQNVLALSNLPAAGAPLLLSVGLPAIVAMSVFGAQRLLGFVYCLATILPFLLMGDISLGAPVAALAGLLLATIVQARTDQVYTERRRRNTLRGEQARLLLTEFEAAGRGWFWETDRTGALTYVSETLARKAGRTVEELMGSPISDLLGASAGGEDKDGRRTVGFHISARSAFSEIAVRAPLPDEERWWSVSGRPVINDYGQFMGFRGSGSDLTEMRKSQAEVTRLARFDSLTGLANRAQMQATLEEALVDSTNRPRDCALFILDLDRFKVVNDTMGHPAGDALLRQVAQRLSRTVGKDGKVGRLGGDEFQVILPGMIDHTALARLAENIIHSVSQPYAIEASQVVIGVSVGIAIAPQDGLVAETLVRNADLALYKAKDAGRGVFCFYSQDMHADAEDRRKLEQDLRHAINTGGLHVEYQPVVSATTERISGFEALARWAHPTRGPISPAVFVPIAEEAGIIAQIGEWMLRTACQDAAGWPDDVRVAVNVSPVQFANAGFPALVVNALAKSGIRPERLELEITESVFLDDSGNTDAMFTRLKAIGVRLALDDFGTGYSALGYLKTAPFDKIKIDQSFVRGAAVKGNRNGAIVKSIVSLADALSMETTAEGAETLDELALIRELGCSHIQGYVYGRPELNTAVLARFSRGEHNALPSGFQSSREARRTMLRSIRLTHGTNSYDARIRNISTTGAMVEGLADVPPGTLFEMTLGKGYSINVTCRWSSGAQMGVEFAQPIRLAGTRATDDKTFLSSDLENEEPQQRLMAG